MEWLRKICKNKGINFPQCIRRIRNSKMFNNVNILSQFSVLCRRSRSRTPCLSDNLKLKWKKPNENVLLMDQTDIILLANEWIFRIRNKNIIIRMWCPNKVKLYAEESRTSWRQQIMLSRQQHSLFCCTYCNRTCLADGIKLHCIWSGQVINWCPLYVIM